MQTGIEEQRRARWAPMLPRRGDITGQIDITAQPTATLMPHAELLVYEGAQHGVPYTPTDHFNSDLLTFLAG
jgi:hypothetical protein